MKKILLK